MARDAITIFEHSYNLKNDKLLSEKVLIIDYLRHFFEVASPIPSSDLRPGAMTDLTLSVSLIANTN